MNRLQAELQRLYLLPAAALAPTAAPAAPGPVRAMLLELGRPADWNALAAVWRGVQSELGLPAPAIAVSGLAGYQLWFSLQEAVPAAQAAAFLNALRGRYLAGLEAGRVRALPADDATGEEDSEAANLVLPPRPTAGGRWAAFVAPDLAPVFADEPWLDTPPNDEGQADLLQRLECIGAAEFRAALQQLGGAAAEAARPVAAPPARAPSQAGPPSQDPRAFLLGVMNDAAAPLHLRIEAAKALLPGVGDPPSGR